jgi:hypothetical protein
MTSHGVWNVAAERLGHGSVRKASVCLLSKDAEIRAVCIQANSTANCAGLVLSNPCVPESLSRQ